MDSPVLSRAGANPYQLIGEWDDGYVGGATVGCFLDSLSPLHVWLGLRSSDDQGTNFDFRADVSFTSGAPGAPTILIASAPYREKVCFIVV